jgi:hypothetical protein
MPVRITQPSGLDEDVLALVIAEIATHYAVEQIVIPISYTDATGVVGTLDENVLVLDRAVVRTTPWNTDPLFTLGTAALPTLLIKDNQHALNMPGAGTARIAGDAYRTTASTPLLATWNQNGATAGAGYVVITYVRL